MIRFSFGRLGAVIAAMCVFLGLMSGCGSGAVSAPPTSSPITITPSKATLFSDLPSTFFVGRDGLIKATQLGELDDQALQSGISKIV